MTENNQDLKEYARQNKVYLYEIADELQLSEWTLIRRLRKPFPENESKKFIKTVDRLAKRKEDK